MCTPRDAAVGLGCALAVRRGARIEYGARRYRRGVGVSEDFQEAGRGLEMAGIVTGTDTGRDPTYDIQLMADGGTLVVAYLNAGDRVISAEYDYDTGANSWARARASAADVTRDRNESCLRQPNASATVARAPRRSARIGTCRNWQRVPARPDGGVMDHESCDA
ncbi:YdcF family protein [Ancylobacter sp. MQZ15Z-1]|uniref:YdcF family protein n=1 Tax=Ancylobacter mangrovi TaxID=2972472 RepID=A0A9X2PGH9_9HYPH|nr:YdcF family protein [Ancylobacter mangrovi]MCS0494098.1 YdcF family protein [Ancylobacter mangrovi]